MPARRVFTQAVIGLSGGIDSSVTCAVAARALGPENILGISLPSRYSSQGSLDDARGLAENLGIDYRVVNIDDIYAAYLTELAPHFAGTQPDTAEENIQARIRGNIWMAFFPTSSAICRFRRATRANWLLAIARSMAT